jgi:hypothetical protein
MRVTSDFLGALVKRLLPSSCLSVRLHLTTLHQVEGIARKFILGIFTKIFQHIQIFVNIEPK